MTSVVLSYGLGVDSTAILLRWIHDPASRDFDLSELLVITAMTGDEWSLSGDLVTEHILPLLREHQIRYVQVARTAVSTTEWTVLDDSTSPERLFIEGAYKLSDEMFAAGTIPQLGGARLCSMHAKGEVLDQFLLQDLNGRPFRHAIGFEANEPSRAKKDKGYDTKGKLAGQRTGWYPLIEWGWTRDDCIDYIYAKTGAKWPKSACTFCPFALANKAGRKQTLERFEEYPQEGAKALFMEHVSEALNPSQILTIAPLPTLVSRETWDAFTSLLASQEHAIYEVRRVVRAAKDKETEEPIHTKKGNISRKVTRLAQGSREEMLAMLHQLADRVGSDVETSDDERDIHQRVWMLPRPEVFPGVEQLLTVAPAVVPDKSKPNFEQWWLEASMAQHRLARS